MEVSFESNLSSSVLLSPFAFTPFSFSSVCFSHYFSLGPFSSLRSVSFFLLSGYFSLSLFIKFSLNKIQFFHYFYLACSLYLVFFMTHSLSSASSTSLSIYFTIRPRFSLILSVSPFKPCFLISLSIPFFLLLFNYLILFPLLSFSFYFSPS